MPLFSFCFIFTKIKVVIALFGSFVAHQVRLTKLIQVERFSRWTFALLWPNISIRLIRSPKTISLVCRAFNLSWLPSNNGRQWALMGGGKGTRTAVATMLIGPSSTHYTTQPARTPSCFHCHPRLSAYFYLFSAVSIHLSLFLFHSFSVYECKCVCSALSSAPFALLAAALHFPFCSFRSLLCCCCFFNWISTHGHWPQSNAQRRPYKRNREMEKQQWTVAVTVVSRGGCWCSPNGDTLQTNCALFWH